MDTGPGQILAIRQTIQQDNEGNPILEQYQLEQAGNVIDGNGVWLIELPMNLDYVVTSENGELVLSENTAVGLPTRSSVRFRIAMDETGGEGEVGQRPATSALGARPARKDHPRRVQRGLPEHRYPRRRRPRGHHRLSSASRPRSHRTRHRPRRRNRPV